jgi:hypothetical protein
MPATNQYDQTIVRYSGQVPSKVETDDIIRVWKYL